MKTYKNFFTKTKRWTEIKFIKARISDFNSEVVLCDCIIEDDISKEIIFEKRTFSINLFSKTILKEKQLIFIVIKTKIGTIKIDIKNATNKISDELFVINDRWDKLKQL